MNIVFQFIICLSALFFRYFLSGTEVFDLQDNSLMVSCGFPVVSDFTIKSMIDLEFDFGLVLIRCEVCYQPVF